MEFDKDFHIIFNLYWWESNAKEILQREMLPHIGMSENRMSRKAFYIGYIVHRLLLVALGRREVCFFFLAKP